MAALDGLSAEQIIESFLTASDPAAADRALGVLLEGHVREPIHIYFTTKISTTGDQSNFRFTRFDAEDLASQALIELAKTLRQRRAIPSSAPITNLRAFINAVCRAVYSDFWRHRFKEYTKLKNRLRYLLRSRSQMFCTERIQPDTIICYLPDSPRHASHYVVTEIAEQVRDARPDFPVADEVTLLLETLENARGWLSFGDAVEIVAMLRGVKDIPPSEVTVPESDIDGRTDGSDGYSRYINRFELAFLWKEICDLPRFQRLSLIYNLRDERGQELNCVWFEAGIATLAEIAEQFELEEPSMAELLVELPYSDRRIAEVLGIEEAEIDGRSIKPEVKVANLRKVARENLLRRRDGKEKRKR